MADALVESGASEEVMIVTADNYSNFMDDELGLEILFSDAVSISTVSKFEPQSHATDRLLSSKIVSQASFTRPGSHGALGIDKFGALHMNGAAVFQFTIEEVPRLIKTMLGEKGLNSADVDWFMHQGSKFVVDQLELALNLGPKEHFRSANYGNTVSGSIPFQLLGYEFSSEYIGLAGFGMGLSARIAILKNLNS
jgi:3-oxoacyl-[acyl-carrier-protein] synthase-3